MKERYPGQYEHIKNKLIMAESAQEDDRALAGSSEDQQAIAEAEARLVKRTSQIAALTRTLAVITEEESPRDRVLRIRLSDQEYTKLEQAAMGLGLGLAEYIRLKSIPGAEG